MNLAIEELNRSLKYHQRQLDDNLRDIQSKKEAIQLLESANEKEIQTIEHLQQAIELIKMDMELSHTIPTEKQPTDSITEESKNENIQCE